MRPSRRIAAFAPPGTRSAERVQAALQHLRAYGLRRAGGGKPIWNRTFHAALRFMETKGREPWPPAAGSADYSTPVEEIMYISL